MLETRPLLHQLFELGREGGRLTTLLQAWWRLLFVGFQENWRRVPFSTMFLALAKKQLRKGDRAYQPKLRRRLNEDHSGNLLTLQF